MKTSRMTLYLFIALIAVIISYYVLANEPHPDWPINLIHLITRH